MYAVFSDRSKQYLVQEGQQVEIDLLEQEPGASIEFDRVLLLGGRDGGPVVGQPTVAGVKVLADVVEHYKEKKIHIQVYKKRKNFRRHQGHRQPMTRIKIKQIVVG